MSQSSQCTPKKRHSSPICTPVKFSSVQSSPLMLTSTEQSPKKRKWDIPDLQRNMQYFHATFETQCKAILYDLSCGGVAEATQEIKKLLQQSKSFMAEANPAINDFNLRYKALTQKVDFIQKYNTDLQKENAELKQEIQNLKAMEATMFDEFEDSTTAENKKQEEQASSSQITKEQSGEEKHDVQEEQESSSQVTKEQSGEQKHDV